MSKYDLHPVSGSGSFLLDVQADILDDITSRVVVPVVPIAQTDIQPNPLNPRLTVAGVDYILVTPSLAAVPAVVLKHPVANMSEHHDQITRALDFLFQGY